MPDDRWVSCAGEAQRMRHRIERINGLLHTVLACIAGDVPVSSNVLAALNECGNLVGDAARYDVKLTMKKEG